MMTNLSMSIVNILYNFQLIRFAGEDGIAAYGVIMYLNFVFISVFLGYSVGSAPIISFHFGAENQWELKNLFQKSIKIIVVCSVSMTIFGRRLHTAVRRAEEAVAALETEIEDLTRRLESPEVAADYARLTELTALLEQKNQDLAQQMEAWEQYQLELEQLEDEKV